MDSLSNKRPEKSGAYVALLLDENRSFYVTLYQNQDRYDWNERTLMEQQTLGGPTKLQIASPLPIHPPDLDHPFWDRVSWLAINPSQLVNRTDPQAVPATVVEV